MMDWKKTAMLLCSACLCLSLTACGTQTEKKAAPASSGEKKVTVYMPSPAGLSKKLAQGFEKKTGIKVETFQGTTGEILARLETEKNNPTADVVILASWSDGLNLKKQGGLLSYAPQNSDKLVKGWQDPDHQLTGYSASAVGVIYNTRQYPKLDADWAELGDAAYKDKLAIPDPEKSGACKDFLAGYVNKYGWSALEAMAKNGMRGQQGGPGSGDHRRSENPGGRRGLQCLYGQEKGRTSGYLLSQERYHRESPAGHDLGQGTPWGERQEVHGLSPF